MYWGLTHTVMPKENALACATCHISSLAKAPYCGRCHQERKGVDFKALATKGIDFKALKNNGMDVSELIGKSDYIDYKALGYKGDPIEYGVRFQRLKLGKVD